jgi:hypothetical protein
VPGLTLCGAVAASHDRPLRARSVPVLVISDALSARMTL